MECSSSKENSLPSEAGARRRLARWLGRWWPLLPILGAAYLALQGLPDNYFWDDEAGTAIFARNYLRFGKLTAWDGWNLMAYRNGFELDDDFINRYVPPLQFYLCAASFRLLGETTFAGRLPFVLSGLLALAAFFLLLKLESGEARGFRFFSLLLLALSPSFLLFIRQCRYFPLVILFPLVAYGGYRLYIERGRGAGLILSAAGFLGLFFSHYLACLCFAVSLAAVHLVFHLRARRILPLLLAGAFCLAVAVAYIAYVRVILPPLPAAGKAWLAERGVLFLWNLREINAYGFLPWAVLPLLAWLACDRSFNAGLKRLAGEWLVLCLLFVVAVSIFSPQPFVGGGDADVRYLISLLPFFAGMAGIAAHFLWGKCRIIAAAFVLLLLFTNLLTLNPWFPIPLRFDLVAYAREIHSDYTTAYEAATLFIRKNCRKGDVIVVIPPNMTFPLQFYAGDYIRFGGILDGMTKLDRGRVRALSPSLLFEECEPDWLVSFGLRNVTFEIVNYYAGRGIFFRPPEVIAAYYLGEQIRPEILLRIFGPVEKFDPGKEGVLFFKRSAGGKEY